MPRVRPLMSKHWCFTVNNPTDADALTPDDLRHIDYMIINKENGENETPHWQGYVCFNARLRMTRVQTYFPRAALFIKRGTVQQARHYCMKPVPGCDCEHCTPARERGEVADYMEWGEVPNTNVEAVKQKWKKLITLSKQGKFEELEDDYPSEYFRHYHIIKRMRQDHPDQLQDLEAYDNYWIVAPTGYGKSRYAREQYPDFYDKAPNKWWIGYANQSTIICDDFSPKQCEHLGWYMKRWADLFPYPYEDKGGGGQMRPKRIVVTSQYTIQECFEDYKVVEAMERRFTVVNLARWQDRVGDEDEVPGNPTALLEEEDLLQMSDDDMPDVDVMNMWPSYDAMDTQ